VSHILIHIDRLHGDSAKYHGMPPGSPVPSPFGSGLESAIGNGVTAFVYPAYASVHPGFIRHPVNGSWILLCGNPVAEGGTGEAARALALQVLTQENPDLLELMEAPFAAVCHDSIKGTLHIVTDAPGVQHLYYAMDASGWWITSAPHFLARYLGLEKNPESIAQFLAFGELGSDASFYTGIAKIPGGVHWVMDRTEVVRRNYWRLDFPESRMTGEIPARERFEQLYEHSLALRTTDQEIILQLSGGIDSRLVGAELFKAGKEFSAFTIGMPDDIEMILAKQICGILDIRHSRVEPAEIGIDQALRAVRNNMTIGEYEQNPMVHAVSCAYYESTMNHRRTQLGGNGGEIMRGPFYPSVLITGSQSVQAWKRKLMRYHLLPITCIPQKLIRSGALPPLLESISDLYQQYIDASFARNLFDHADNIYLQQVEHRFTGRSATTAQFYHRFALPMHSRAMIDFSVSIDHWLKMDSGLTRTLISKNCPLIGQMPYWSMGRPLKAERHARSPGMRAVSMLARICENRIRRELSVPGTDRLRKNRINEAVVRQLMLPLLDSDGVRNIFRVDELALYLDQAIASGSRNTIQLGQICSILHLLAD